MGFIQQTGTIKSGLCGHETVYYNHRTPDTPWYSAATQEPLHPTATPLITNRVDKGPAGIIRVIGNVDFKRMMLKDANNKKRGKLVEEQADLGGKLHTFLKHRYRVEKSAKRGRRRPEGDSSSEDDEEELQRKNAKFDKLAMEEKAAGSAEEKKRKAKELERHGLTGVSGADEEDNLQNIIDANDEDGSLLTTGDLAKFIKQYLTRSVVTAAKSKGAIIINTDSGDIKTALARGVQASGETRDLGDDSQYYIPVDTGKVPVLNIQKYEEGLGIHHEAFLRTGGGDVARCFSHNLFLRNRSMSPTPDGYECTSKDITEAVLRILEAGNKGGLGTHYPQRAPARVVGILVGGDVKSAKFDILPFVQNKWPLLIIEGSGGYADELASLIRKIEQRSGGTASKDDYQSYLSNVESSTAQIIYEGEWKLVRKGLVPETLTRIIQQAVTGDEILTRAWESYAAWDELAYANEMRYRNLMMWILVLGTLVTAISIFQTFLQLQWKNETDAENSSGTRKWAGGSVSVVSEMYSSLSIVVVVLPITISLMQSITNKINAGAKWVSLKSAAEGLLSEIYMYRTRSGAYSDQEIKKAFEKRMAAKRAKEKKDANDKEEQSSNVPQYSTRSELLHVRLTAFTQELVQSEMSENSIPKYTGPVPPHSVTRYGDDGYSELSINEYVKMRLSPKVAAYNKDAVRYDKYKTRITLTIYGLGALGTALAALATFEQLRGYNIGAWVALTTSLGSALTRYLDYTKTEWLHNKYTAVMHELESLDAWWSARGSDGAKAACVDEMVAGCEEKITEEITEFKQQLKIAVAEAAKEAEKQAEDRAAIKDAMLRGEQPELVKKMETLGISGFNADAIEAALKDPTGPEALQLKKLMQRVDDELGGVVEKAKIEIEKTKLGKALTSRVQDLAKYKDMMDTAINVLDNLKELNPFNVEKLIPQELLDTIKDNNKRKQFLSYLESKAGGKDPWQLGYQELLGIAKGCGREFKKQMSELPYRVAMEGIGKMCFTELFSQFEEALDKMGLNALDFVESRDQVDVFISEMKKLASLPANCDKENVIAACSSLTMKNTLQGMSESKMRSLIKRASKYFIESSPTLELLKSAADVAADMDLDLVFEDNEELKCQVMASVNSLTEEFPEHFLDKMELLSVFPDEIVEAFKDKSHAQVVSLFSRLKKGSLNKKMLDTFLASPDELNKLPSVLATQVGTAAKTLVATNINKLANYPSLEVLLHSFDNRQKFSAVAKNFAQHEINNMSKSAMLKKIQNTLGTDCKLVQDLKLCSEEGIRLVMSGIRAAYSASYSGRVFDRVAEEIVSFDVDMIFDYEDKEKLVARMKDFKGVNVLKKNREFLTALLGYKTLVKKAAALDLSQLQELILRLTSHMQNSFSKRVFDKARDLLDQCFHNAFKEAGLADWGDQMVDRFVSQCIIVSDEVLAADFDHDDIAFKQAVVGDESLLRLTSSLTAEELRRLMVQVKELAGEKVIANIFETASKDIQSEELYHTFDSAFMLPAVRHRLVMCMTNLLMEKKKVIHLIDVTDDVADAVIARLKQAVELPTRVLDAKGKVVDPGVDLCDEIRDEIAANCCEGHNEKLVNALRRIFRGKNRLHQVIQMLLGEMKISMGYRLFTKLAEDLSSFSLKEVVKNSRARYCLCPLFIRILWSKRFGFKPSREQDGSFDLTALILTKGGALETMNPTKENIIRLLEEFDDGPMEAVTGCLTRLTLQQFKLLIGSIYKLMRTTYAGAFFQMLERAIMMQACTRGSIGSPSASTEDRRRKFVAEDTAKRDRNEAIACIRKHVRIRPEQVAGSFDNFDARLFASRLTSDKKRILSRYVASDEIVNTISGYYENQIKAFFGYIRTAPQFQVVHEVDEEDHFDDEAEEDGTIPRTLVDTHTDSDKEEHDWHVALFPSFDRRSVRSSSTSPEHRPKRTPETLPRTRSSGSSSR
eukprot:TRINITY_DN8227_c0_g1_i1.p1 TRINITY_DN8227_c0_g1~~TRINITY_DN8227_c0_g1_i1.p1  ORF type:complete len:2019 (+),score=741.12 TRINITY_DN8227_c0_g1_i1:232-6057(+)